MENFKTPHGLKIRLNPKYFYRLFTGETNNITEEKMVSHDKMYAAVASIEVMFQLTSALIFYYTVVACFYKAPLTTYSTISSLLFIFGNVLRYIKPPLLLSTILYFVVEIYNRIWFLPYLILAVVFIATKSLELFLCFIVIKIVGFVFEWIFDMFLRRYSMEKYKMPFGDTEYCAFRMFHHFLISEQKFSEFIKQYCYEEQSRSEGVKQNG